jgi:hypothetical protein
MSPVPVEGTDSCSEFQNYGWLANKPAANLFSLAGILAWKEKQFENNRQYYHPRWADPQNHSSIRKGVPWCLK